MRRFVLGSLLAVVWCLPASLGQEAKKEDKGAKKEAAGHSRIKLTGDEPLPGEVDVHFLNGSTVRMVLQSDKMEIATLYGKLSVPIKDIRGIEFGLHFPDGVADKIQRAVKSLASSEYRERDNASKMLTELGPYSYPAVLEARHSKDPETARRAKEILKKLQAKHPKKDLKTTTDDKLVTPTFTIVGRILTPSVKARTEYFGEVELSLAKMRTLRAIASPSVEVEVAIDATRYANAGQWLETAFSVDGKTPLVITVKGLVDTWPQGPGQYMSGPNGVQGGRMVGGGIVIGGPGVGGGRVVGGGVGQMLGGALLGKIGEDGEAFLIGERYDGSPDREGKLYLHIGPSPWNCQSTGSYQVKISRKE